MKQFVAIVTLTLVFGGAAFAMTAAETAQIQQIHDHQAQIQLDAVAIRDEPNQWSDIAQTAEGINQLAIASQLLAADILAQG